MGARVATSSVSPSKNVRSSNLEQVLESWAAYKIAWILCVEWRGDWTEWNIVKVRFLEAASQTGMHMVGEQVFKHTMLTLIHDYGLIEAHEEPADKNAWKKCLEERRKRAERDKRIKKTPEEYCREKIRRRVSVRAAPALCRILLTRLERRGLRLPPATVEVLRRKALEEVAHG